MYQKTDINFTEVNPVMHSTVATLVKIRDCKSGSVLQRHTIRDSAKQRQEAVSACEHFVTEVVENLRDRFSYKGDALVMTVVSGLFDPSVIASDSVLSSDDIDTITTYLQSVSIKKADLDNEALGFHEYIRNMSGSKTVSSVKDVAQVAVKQICSYPSLGLLAKRLLVLPVSTVDCERGSSKQNLIKTDLRNSIKPASLDNLMRISIERPPCSEFNYDKAYDVWASMKPRRIL
ncbi:hypothetical protein KUTeg_021456 [Tegillarca granosa]|uniref:HAT C-terminal dimerisation domain-containing protein n=1 Tax=Tegillarca granosa TaxID=220873 RepID=A0ABQ9E8P6_TEGGR|nr:hypothetical protein KUTeg_021456 [Tegillarca granosa]